MARITSQDNIKEKIKLNDLNETNFGFRSNVKIIYKIDNVNVYKKSSFANKSM